MFNTRKGKKDYLLRRCKLKRAVIEERWNTRYGQVSRKTINTNDKIHTDTFTK